MRKRCQQRTTILVPSSTVPITKMASNDEDDTIIEEESVALRRTRSGRPVATAKRGRGRKKGVSPRAPRATRNTRAKQQLDDDEEEEMLDGSFADCDTTRPSSDHGSSGEQDRSSPIQREEATSSSDGGGDKIQFCMDEDYSVPIHDESDGVEQTSTNGLMDNEAEATEDSYQEAPSSPEGEECQPVDNGFEMQEASEEQPLEYEGGGECQRTMNEEVPELEASPPPSVAGSVTSTIFSNLRQRSIDKVDEDGQSQDKLPGLDQPKVVEELNTSGEVEEDQESAMDVYEMPDGMVDRVKAESKVSVEMEYQEAQESEALIEETSETEVKMEIKHKVIEEDIGAEPDTEMVSEDELPTESKEPLETEAVSDEELPDPAGPRTEDLPETEEVSEDELPPEKSYKKKSKSSLKQDKKATGSESTSSSSKKKKKSRPESQKRKLLVGDSYDPSSPTSENSQDDPPAAKKAAIAIDGDEGSKSATTKAQAQQRKMLPELDKYWKAVKEDPSDFTGWTYLLQYVDQENDIEAAREAYDSFLSHYPYCYGYWRKYADYEKRKSNKEKCEEVFQRGLKAIPLSVDLWIHYLNYCKSTNPDEEDFLREQFEKAIGACGLEFRSDRLWESYIKWEAEGKRLQRVMEVYDRLLTTPTQSYMNHFESFTALVNAHPPQKLLSVDEFLTERREVLQQLKQYEQPKAVVDPAGPPGEEGDAPPGEESEEKMQVRNDEETTALREKIISIRRKTHKLTVTAVSDRWVFEEAIKRPYFHVKPLERCQLKNWREYLDYEVTQGDRARIIVLFERCLIACALYEDLWLKFIRYLENLKEEELTDKIRDVYERACTIHHTKKPNLHLYWAVFEETHGNCDKASKILIDLEKIVPNMLQIAYRRINLERRRGQLDEVCNLYDHYISTAKNKVIANNMAIKCARFCLKVKGDITEALSILNKAIEKDKENPRLYLQLVDMSLQRSPIIESEVIESMDLFLENKEADIDQKVLFAQRKVEFLEDFGANVFSVQKAQDEFTRYCKQAKDKKKKMAEEAKGESKKSKASTSSGDTTATAPTAASPSPSAAPPQYPPSYPPTGYSGAPAPPYQGQYPPTGQQPPYQYNQQYNQSDPNYANYQNWGYSQTGYGGYNQGWTSNYNYY